MSDDAVRLSRITTSRLAQVLKVMNQLQAEGLIKDYAIGGSMAIVFYSEPFMTRDVDFFCSLNQDTLLYDWEPIFNRLTELGYPTEGLYKVIEGVPVQFLAPDGPLLAEAMETAISTEIDGVPARVLDLEYALAIKVDANRTKDWMHINLALESAQPDMQKLMALLNRFGLEGKWRRDNV